MLWTGNKNVTLDAISVFYDHENKKNIEVEDNLTCFREIMFIKKDDWNSICENSGSELKTTTQLCYTWGVTNHLDWQRMFLL